MQIYRSIPHHLWKLDVFLPEERHKGLFKSICMYLLVVFFSFLSLVNREENSILFRTVVDIFLYLHLLSLSHGRTVLFTSTTSFRCCCCFFFSFYGSLVVLITKKKQTLFLFLFGCWILHWFSLFVAAVVVVIPFLFLFCVDVCVCVFFFRGICQ